MPALAQHKSTSITKMLLIGDSGTGKTGALASLPLAGFNMRVLDFDNGLDIVANLLKDSPEALAKVHYETCTDSFKNLNGRLVPKKAKAWAKAMKLLDHWKVGTPATDTTPASEGFYDLGKVTSWNANDILVIDSLTHMGHAAMRYIQEMNGKLGEHPRIQDWGFVQTLIADLLSLLYDDEVKCNVVVTAHIDYIWEERKDEKDRVVERILTKGYPSAPGAKLSPKVGSYFNSMLQVVMEGNGVHAKRKIITNPLGVIDLKNSNPAKVKKSYPVETGLAEFFKDVRS